MLAKKNKTPLGSRLFFFITLMSILIPRITMALSSDEILVVANRNASNSVGLAKYYMGKRSVPEDNLVLLWVTDKETCTRDAYVKKVIPPIRRFLDSPAGKEIRCIVTLSGVPLKISPPEYDEKEQKELNWLTQKRDRLAAEMENSAAPDKEIQARYDKMLREIKHFKSRHDKWASLDSELSLIKSDNYDLSSWLANPFYLPYKNDKKMAFARDGLIMVSRLDGPDADIVKRIIDDSIAVEAKGLSGNACFDARWKRPDEKKTVQGYGLADKLIHLAADVVSKSKLMKQVIKNDEGKLFQSGECPDTALYCGWYSLARYVDAFTWTKGAVGYHIASSECATLRAGKSQVWCKRMLEEGVAATVGPVGEPYVQSFPNTEIFFKFLLDGYLSLVECYYLSLPHVSWKQVLVGDPLYQPFKAFRRNAAVK